MDYSRSGAEQFQILADHSVSLAEERASAVVGFWTRGGKLPPGASLEALCDVAYTYFLADKKGELSEEAAKTFALFLSEQNLAGFSKVSGGAYSSVHNTAYALGTLNLFGDLKSELYQLALGDRLFQLQLLVRPDTYIPLYPAKWAHHSWRVSHWVGGVPSILLSLSKSGLRSDLPFHEIYSKVRNAAESLIVERTGLLRTYRSDALQLFFRLLYGLRHRPEIGDLGGIAHILWTDYASGRPYTGAPSLYQLARRHFIERRPFMEAVPYCLDFDIVQIVRTAGDETNQRDAEVISRAATMMDDIVQFFRVADKSNYTLHKIPGALATYHECSMLQNPNINKTRQRDIIKDAFWI
jgi:hypothetical protein